MLLIGIDAGGTKVNAWEVINDNNNFQLGEANFQCKYSEIYGFKPDFKPVDLTIQLKEQSKEKINLTEAEVQQGQVYLEAIFKAILSISEQKGITEVITGIGTPGLKSRDGKGIEVFANGPRFPEFVPALEKRLADAGIKLVSPIKRLGSDSDYCGIGEEYAEDGLFRNIPNVYYIGGGTGVADVMKLNNRLVFFDQAREWMAKSWEMISAHGKSFEKYISSKGMVENWEELSKFTFSELEDKGFYPLTREKIKNDKHIRTIISQTANVLAELIFERIHTLYSGSDNEKKFVNKNRAKLSKNHPFLGSVFDRIIVGQRLGEIWSDVFLVSLFQNVVKKELVKFVMNSDSLDSDIKKYYVPDGKRFRNDMIISSKLREAPVLGAAINAGLKAI